MKVSSKRLFLKDLPPVLTEKDINDKFSKFGEVIAIEIKERKNMTVKSKFPTYAFININVDDYKLQQCFEDFAKNKWKGNYVELQVAKQNFLEKLKEERENDGKSKSNLHNDIKTPNYNLEFNTKQCYSNITSGVTDMEELPLRKKKKFTADFENTANEEMPLNQNNRKAEIIEYKTISNNRNVETVSNGQVNTKMSKLSITAEEKRLKSINQMKQSYRKQKDAIKAALMNVDTSPSKKIVFNDEGDIKHVSQNNVTEGYMDKKYNLNSDRKALFGGAEDDDDEHEYNFEIKEQFQGKKGKKLLELQSKFKSDKRFAMDERFLEDENCADELEERIDEKPKIDFSETENNILITTEEKQKELSILEEVLGRRFITTDQDLRIKKNFKSASMMRYDPSKPEHSRFILKESEVTKEKTPKKKDNQHANVDTEIEKPTVSKEVFYEVDDNLKETFQENKSFSLLNMFGSHLQSDDAKKHNGIVHDTKATEKGKLLDIKEKNPFQYDSSDESGGEDQVVMADSKSDKMKDETTPQNVTLGPAKLWTEPFFFNVDDYRLQEGVDFVRRFELDDTSEFKQVRRNIKEIVRAKVRNNQRKNRHFKKKIGGKRMVKLRKAMKNR